MSYAYIYPDQGHMTGPYGSTHPIVSPNSSLTHSAGGNSIQNPRLFQNQPGCNPSEITNNRFLALQPTQMNTPHFQQSYITTQSNYQTENGPKPFSDHVSNEYSQQNRHNVRGNFLGPQNAPQQYGEYQSRQVQHQYSQQSQQNQPYQQGQQSVFVEPQQQQQNKLELQIVPSHVSLSSGQYSNHQISEQYPHLSGTFHQNQPQTPSQRPLQQLQQPLPQQQDLRFANQVNSSDASPWQSPYQFATSQSSSQNQWEQFDNATPNDQNGHLYDQPRIIPNEGNPNRHNQNHPIPSNSFVYGNQQRDQRPFIQGATHNNEISNFKRQGTMSSDSKPQGIYTNSISNANGGSLHVNAPSERKVASELNHNDLSAQQHMTEYEIPSSPGFQRQFSGQSYQPPNIKRVDQINVATGGYFSQGRQYGHQNNNDMNTPATQPQSEKNIYFKSQPQPLFRMPLNQNQPPAPLHPHFHSQPQIQNRQQHHNVHSNSQLPLQNQPQTQIESHPQNWSQFQVETKEHIRPQTSVNGIVITSINMSNQLSMPFYQTAGTAPLSSKQALQSGHSPIPFANHIASGSRPSHATNAKPGISTSGGQGILYTVSAPLPTQQVNFTGPNTMGGYISAPSTAEAQSSTSLASDASTRIPSVGNYSSLISGSIPFQAHSMNPQEINANNQQSQNRPFVPTSGRSHQHNLVNQMQGLSLQGRRGSDEIVGIIGQSVEPRNEARLINRPTFTNSANMVASGAGYGPRFAIERDRENPPPPQWPNTGASGHRLGPNSQVVRFPTPNTFNDPSQSLRGGEPAVRPIDPQTAHRFMNEPPIYVRPSLAGQSAAINSQGMQGLEMNSMQPSSMHRAYTQPFANRVVTSGHSMVSTGHPIVIMPGYASSNIPNRGQKQSNFEARTESILQHISDKQGPMYDKLKKVLTDIFKIQDEVSAFKGRRGDKSYIFIEEMLTRQLLALDAVNAEGNEELRLTRRSIVKQVQGLLSSLEMKAKT